MTIVLKTAYDAPTRTAAILICEFAQTRSGWVPDLEDLANLCDPSNTGMGWTYLAEYAIEVLNEDAPMGHWYTLTADFNVALDVQEEP
jgi:hypothetical protein